MHACRSTLEDPTTVKFLLSYATKPLQIFGMLGLVMGAAGGLVLAWLAYVRVVDQQAIGDRPLLLLGILLIFTGIQLLTLGLLAELQARTYHESQDKPTYIVRTVLESEQEPALEPAAARRV